MAANTATNGAVDISIDVKSRMEGRGILTANLTPAGAELIYVILDELAFLLGEFIDLVWPVDTGASQADWETTAERYEWVIRNPREYAEYVHRKDETEEVYLEIARRSEELLAGAWSRITAAAARSRRSKATPSLLKTVQRFLLPSIVGEDSVSRGTIFAARAAGFLEQSTRSRERERARARAR